MPWTKNNRGSFELKVDHELGLDDVSEAIRICNELREDPEGSHIVQDQIYVAVLQAVADLHADSASLARAALKIEELPFSRWYA